MKSDEKNSTKTLIHSIVSLFTAISTHISIRSSHQKKRKRQRDKGNESCLCVCGKKNVLILSNVCHFMCVHCSGFVICWHKYHINFHANPQKWRRTFTNLTFRFFFLSSSSFIRSYVHAVVHIFIKIITVFRFLFFTTPLWISLCNLFKFGYH